ncbi:hypothetical protein B0T26DRAFT_100012 [Lasiosphaeria miniovina]|uniref:PLD phosphodiesterase domain-containing protein n=1 Tax=Lasiosphaeria miniovina TaxID=1954250 RepID=A0AA40EF63_9PEZI|nr:uncharacterized protein B0T26DRAFT_100012 [Lasiosphaeria miniovina]KAK0735276.1 hypothetical protein B0T26DRAFT_100012 [Lasiosphaeria miniovina]
MLTHWLPASLIVSTRTRIAGNSWPALLALSFIESWALQCQACCMTGADCPASPHSFPPQIAVTHGLSYETGAVHVIIDKRCCNNIIGPYGSTNLSKKRAFAVWLEWATMGPSPRNCAACWPMPALSLPAAARMRCRGIKGRRRLLATMSI